MPKPQFPFEQLDAICRRYGIARLSLFGSTLIGTDRPDSDIDLLAEFLPGQQIGYFELAEIEHQLSELLGRKVDLRTPGELSRHFRDRVVAEAEVQYAR